MDFNRFTEKLQDGVRAAQSKAVGYSHQQVDVEHLQELAIALLPQGRVEERWAFLRGGALHEEVGDWTARSDAPGVMKEALGESSVAAQFESVPLRIPEVDPAGCQARALEGGIETQGQDLLGSEPFSQG